MLSCRYERTVARDNTVQLAARRIQIPPGPRQRSYAGCRVEVRELLDGRVMVLYQTVLLVTQPAPTTAFVLKPREQPGTLRRGAADTQRRRTAQLQRAVAALGDVARPTTGLSGRPPTTPAAHPWRTTPFSRRERERQRSRPPEG